LLFFRKTIKENIQEKKLFIISDSIGLGAFCVIGSVAAIKCDLNWFGVVFSGFITAIGGSLVRDILVNNIPYIMTKDIYGTIALVMAFVVYLLDKVGFANFYTLLLLIVIGVAARLYVVKNNLQLPKFG